MEYSLTIWKRAIYVFLPHPCYSGIPFLARELVPSVRFFRKCMRFHLSFQRKNAIFSLKILIYNEICFRKSNGCLNIFRHLRKPYFYLFSKSLKMNTLNHRPKSHISCFFANVGIKFGKRKICEIFSSASKDGKMIKWLIIKWIVKMSFSQINIFTKGLVSNGGD